MLDFWHETMAYAKEFRHELHTYPELSWEEERTAKRIREELSKLDIPWRQCAQTGTVATLNGNSKGQPRIALRSDIDALPITEQSGRQWTSAHSGCMHACGHDGHAATLLASARWLKLNEDKLPAPVTLLFQPAEEGGHGAAKMIEDGALDNVDQIFGWHNWPAIEFGKLACPDGIVMCGNGTFTITVTGRGGHASQPDLCRDPVLAASAITLALQQIISRRLSPQTTSVISVTSIDAVSAPTVIPQTAELSGSIRVPNWQTLEQISTLMEEISSNTAASYGVECEVAIEPRYNATINHAQQAATVRNHWQTEFGPDALDRQHALPIMASEDFSYYLQEIPGAFALIGADDGNHYYPCHSPFYDFNDQLIAKVTRLYARLAGAPLPEQLAPSSV